MRNTWLVQKNGRDSNCIALRARIEQLLRRRRTLLAGAWVLVSCSLLLFGLNGAAMADTATAAPSVCSSVAGPGTVAWNNPTRAYTLNNSSSTTNNLTTTGVASSQYLQCTGYNFAVPAGATINGITLTVWRYASNGACCQDAAVRLVRAGSIQSTDRSTTTFYPNGSGNIASEAHGGATDLWGGAWTVTDINDTNFGSAFASKNTTTNNRTASVDYIEITVNYTPVPTAPTVTTNAASGVTDTGATLNGTVSSNGASTTVTFDYGLTTGYGSTVTATGSPLAAGATNTAVSAAVTGLTCNTLYHFRVKGVNSVGTTNGGDLAFTTAACPPPVVINTYYPGTANAAIGATSITLGVATGATTPIAIGDLLLVMQMQDASIDSTNTGAYGDGVAGDPGSGSTSQGNSGLYEYVVAANAVPLSGGTLTLSCGTLNAYTNAAATGVSGQKKFQVVRVPVFANYTLVPLTAWAWNGSTGGVVAFDVTGALTLNSSSVIADGLGFRGGATTTQGATNVGANTDYRTPVTNNANGSKGEGIAGTPRYVFTAPGTLTDTAVDGYPDGSRARGAPGNAGGGATDRNPAQNDQNPGGGGGANSGAGGIGGLGWCPSFNATAPPLYGCGSDASGATGVNTGGFGGAAVTGLGATRITMGGGGGGGSANNITGTGACAGVNGLCSSGAAGGGIIMVRAGSMSGNATFTAMGSDGDSTVRNDGSGGGGAGGVVLVQAGSGMGGVTINVKGGIGGSNLVPPGSTATPHGPGGGGGGGFAITSAATASCDATGGANGVSYNNGVLFGAYGSTPGSTGSCATSLTSAQIPGSGIGGVPACPSSVNHYAISHSGNGVNCQAEPVTFTAHNASHGAVTLSSAKTITLSTSTSKGDWSLVTGTGTLNNGAANDGIATYQFGNESSAVLALKHTTSGTVNINVTDGAATETSGTALASEDQNLVFAPSGFRFTDGTNPVTIGTQISAKESNLAPGAQSLYLQAIRTDTNTGACVGVFANGTTVNVDMASQCNNPTACIAGQSVRITNNAITTAIASNPNAGVGSYTSVPLRFGANSQAPFTFNYSDAGQISLHARYVIPLGSGGASPDTMVGSGAAFVVRPFGFRITDPPSGRTGGSSAVFTSAGTPFNTTLSAVAWQSADDANSDGVPDNQSALSDNAVTPNFGLETTAATATLSHILAEPSGGAPGALSGATTFSGFTGGARTQSVAFSEVGIIELRAQTTNYLGSGQNITAGASGLIGVGRFIPAYFDVTFTHACAAGGFTHSGQPFATVVVTPYSAVDGAINNYLSATGFAKNTTISNAGDATNFSNNVLVTGAGGNFTGASGNSSTVTYTFAAKETVPLTMTLRAVDTDLVSSAGHLEPNTALIRSGRLQIQNAFGSELLALPVPMHTQYYTANGWVTNAQDNCTTIGSLTLSNGVMPSPVAGASPRTKNIGTGSTTATWAAIASGNAGLSFTAPGAGNSGYVDVTLDLDALGMPWLKFDWDGVVGDDNPAGRVSFGVYRGSPRHIHIRERF